MRPTSVFMALLAMSAASQAGIILKSVDGQGDLPPLPWTA
jgi:hypothetical protein